MAEPMELFGRTLELYGPGRGEPRSARALIERCFEISLYALIVTGFATLAATGRLDAPALLFVTAALIARGYLLARNRQVIIPERWTSYLTLIYVLFYGLDFLFLSASFVTATVHLVLFSMMVKVFSVQRDRDHVYLCVLAFLEVLSAAMLTVDSVFLAAFSLFLLLAVATFITMEMRRATLAAERSGQIASHWIGENGGATRKPRLAERLRRFPAALGLTAAALVVGILAGATVIFFLLPRISAGYLSAFAPRNELVTGFGNDINLGQIGTIQQSSQVVMHITIEGDQGQSKDLKWRGTALDLFHNNRWSVNGHEVGITQRTPEGRFDLKRMQSQWRAPGEQVRISGYKPLRYRVLMEPIGLDVFFLTPSAELLYGHYRQLRMDSGGVVYNDDYSRPISAYQALSNVAQPPPEDLRQATMNYPAGLKIRYLQAPRLDPRVAQLAAQISTGATNNYDRAAAIENYLQTQFGYTLELPPQPVGDPVAYFLFERKRGHCEYFASSMTLMLRSLGIPARIVNGFRTGEYNDLTGSYIIRARDAHSWVEAYFPGYGWISFDPTPAGVAAAPTNWNRMLLYIDAAREFWREWVVNYDFLHQRTLGSRVTTGSRQAAERGRRWLRQKYLALVGEARRIRYAVERSPRRWTLSTLAVLSALLLLGNLRRLLRAWRRRRLMAAPARAPRTAAGLWYQRMARSLAARGWRKRPAQSPREFLVTIQDPELRRSVETFTGCYESARFGGSTEDAEKLPELYEVIAAR